MDNISITILIYLVTNDGLPFYETQVTWKLKKVGQVGQVV